MDKKKWITTFKFLAAYLVAAWTFLQFVDWVLNRYEVSPYWVDLLLWIFVGIIPSLLIYFYHRERINRGKLLRFEKIIFPLNVILLAVIIYFGFGSADLGATTKDINYTDEQGIQQRKTITKEEFRIGVPIYPFENFGSNDSIGWWSQGIGQLLKYDLEQNKSLTPAFINLSETADKIRNASVFYDFYVDGNYNKIGDSISIEVFIRKASNAKVIDQNTFQGNDLLELLDDVSIYITEHVGFVENNRIQYLDLPLKSYMSTSEEAIRSFMNGDYYGAIDLDSTFAMALLENAKIVRRYNQSNLECRDLTDRAYEIRGKLPLQKQLEVIIERSLAYGDYTSAEEQVNLQLEVEPNNVTYNDILYNIYSKNKELDKYLKRAEDRFKTDPNEYSGSRLIVALLVNGEDEKLISYLNKFEIINPMLRIYKTSPLIFQGKVSEADELLKDIKTTYPKFKNTYIPFEKAINYQKSKELNNDLLQQFVGEYRSNYKEQRLTYWINNDRLCRRTNDQPAQAFFLAGDNILAGGLLGEVTFLEQNIKNSKGQTIGILLNQYQVENMSDLWYWKEDNYILEAQKSYDLGAFDQAKALYEVAHKKNPDHVYLKNIIDHLDYKAETEEKAILEQYQRHEGKYGPRNFFTEKGKFYFKVKDSDTESFKTELLPISENSYMDLTRLGYIMIFEENEFGQLISKSKKFEVGEELKFEWIIEQNEDGNNYYTKKD